MRRLACLALALMRCAASASVLRQHWLPAGAAWCRYPSAGSLSLALALHSNAVRGCAGGDLAARTFQEKRSKLQVPGFRHACLALALHGNAVSSCCSGDVALLRARWRYAQCGNLDEAAALLVFLVLRMHKRHVRAPDIDTCKRLSKFPVCMAEISLGR